MGRSCGSVAVAAGVTVLAVVWATAVGLAQREERTRGIEVSPDNPLSGVELTLRIETAARRGAPRSSVQSGDALAVGERVVLCFAASAAGYLAVWNNDPEARVPTRIYPNEFDAETADEAAVWVEGGAETCIGDEDDSFALEIARPLGEASVYLHYTRDMELQFDESDFPVIRGALGPDPALMHRVMCGTAWSTDGVVTWR